MAVPYDWGRKAPGSAHTRIAFISGLRLVRSTAADPRSAKQALPPRGWRMAQVVEHTVHTVRSQVQSLPRPLSV